MPVCTPPRYISRVPLLTIHLILDGIAADMPEALAVKAFEPTRSRRVMRQAPELGRKTVSLYQS